MRNNGVEEKFSYLSDWSNRLLAIEFKNMSLNKIGVLERDHSSEI